MKITLYKNCILTDNYHEVFDLTLKTVDGVKSSVFTDYLKSLEKTEITLENMYYTRNMTFIFSFSGEKRYEEVYSYNYCKIEVEDLVRYCFITDIILCNTVVKYKTKEDIWSNYALDMNIRNSYLARSYKLKYKDKNIDFYKLPIGYQSNEMLKYVPLVGDKTYIDYKNNLMNIVMQVQFYKLSDTKQTERQTRTIILMNKKAGTGYTNLTLTAKEACNFINRFEALVYDKEFNKGNDLKDNILDTTKVYAQIDNVTCVPAIWGLGSTAENGDDNAISATFNFIPEPITGGTAPPFDNYALVNLPKAFNQFLNYTYSSPVAMYQFILKNNFKLLSIGTRTSQFAIETNGTNFEVDIAVTMDDVDFKIFLETQGKSIEITNDFIYDVPFESLTADVAAQRKIARNTAVYRGVSSIASGALQIARSVKGVYLSGGSVEQGGINYNLPMVYTENPVSNFEPTAEYSYERINEGGITGVDFDKNASRGVIGKVSDGILQISNALAPKYTSNYGTFAKSNGLLNACCGGIIGCEIKPDNEIIVNNFIKQTGYIVYEFINNDIIFNQDFTDFNILQFDFCWVSGRFPAYIRNKLEQILTSGFKIWYNSGAK